MVTLLSISLALETFKPKKDKELRFSNDKCTILVFLLFISNPSFDNSFLINSNKESKDKLSSSSLERSISSLYLE